MKDGKTVEIRKSSPTKEESLLILQRDIWRVQQILNRLRALYRKERKDLKSE